MQKKLRFYIFSFGLFTILISITALFIGVYQFNTPITEHFKNIILMKKITDESDAYVLFDLRLPRILMAILVGSGLAVTGTCLQGIFKNPLASPDLIGITSGSILFAAITIVLGHHLYAFLPKFVHYFLLSIMAFIGALLTIWLVYKISTKNGQTNISLLLLSGVAISALCGAGTGLLTYLSTEEELRNLTFWTLGSLAAANWYSIAILSTILFFSFLFLLSKGKTLNTMLLGEKNATHIGIDIEQSKKQIILFSALIVGSIVSFTGTIGFVGLIIPYILRLIFHSNFTYMLPLSAILGASLVIIADTLSRTIVAPAEIPIGILTSLMGAPVFISILIQYKKSLS
ncbi:MULTISPECIES: FecCD family ABC transporter permease [Weeksella]|uniref:Transport system permease protein n=1 Tax=Weeksella virosa (strain ATCC 43766 / DSM 16922 / JCM 21250 / CCUG 30538 / CDC 9751 / IAM 14551 / NBRC 16016 / NCTC 11634 / CL345/78) TaxID=865938 RepID=F0P0C8_WEEVC|nr:MULTISPECIES: iron ABC transporter permease [Weeksella]ADX67412.1 transport system permease protein [Weeksella virosa DSM 16922]MDK7675693.1 iron ABC transporter permease [Weeksella virosa]OFM81948.1 iron ABC transporter [Weeksella sp. HMSC059D05]VEH62847.1 Probable ABC transporter permease protein HI_1471 [Weeksella virosa]